MPNRRIFLAGLAGASLLESAPAYAAKQGSAARSTQFPNVKLITHENKTVRFYDDLVRDKTVLINMMYAECEGICPTITANLRRVYKLLGDQVGRNVFMYSISLQPEKDTPAALAHYVDMHSIGPGWQFMVATRRDTEALRFALGFYDPDPDIDRDKSAHTGMVCIGNEPLNRWCSTPALREADQIAGTVRMVNRSVVVAAGVANQRS
jgi:protein SCO1